MYIVRVLNLSKQRGANIRWTKDITPGKIVGGEVSYFSITKLQYFQELWRVLAVALVVGVIS